MLSWVIGHEDVIELLRPNFAVTARCCEHFGQSLIPSLDLHIWNKRRHYISASLGRKKKRRNNNHACPWTCDLQSTRWMWRSYTRIRCQIGTSRGIFHKMHQVESRLLWVLESHSLPLLFQ
jgi:hypothetical protein